MEERHETGRRGKTAGEPRTRATSARTSFHSPSTPLQTFSVDTDCTPSSALIVGATVGCPDLSVEACATRIAAIPASWRAAVRRID